MVVARIDQALALEVGEDRRHGLAGRSDQVRHLLVGEPVGHLVSMVDRHAEAVGEPDDRSGQPGGHVKER